MSILVSLLWLITKEDLNMPTITIEYFSDLAPENDKLLNPDKRLSRDEQSKLKQKAHSNILKEISKINIEDYQVYDGDLYEEGSFLFRLNNALALKKWLHEFSQDDFDNLAKFMHHDARIFIEFGELIHVVDKDTASKIVEAIKADPILKTELSSFATILRRTAGMHQDIQDIPLIQALTKGASQLALLSSGGFALVRQKGFTTLPKLNGEEQKTAKGVEEETQEHQDNKYLAI